MAFLIERIPEEEKAKLSIELDDYNPALSSRWAIDHERNAFVVIKKKLGGPYEGTQVTKYYVLMWKGQLIHICADPLKPTYSEVGAVMNWRVHELHVPSSLQGQKNEVMQLIREAFSTVGRSFDGDRYTAVNVEFDLS